MLRKDNAMHRFFAERMDDQTALLAPDEARHARTVLRLGPDSEVQVVLGETLYNAQIMDIGETARVRLLGTLPSPEPKTRVTLYQGLPKGDKMDFIVQKCTEAGIHTIVPVNMPRCVARLQEKDAPKKVERWQRIAKEAAKQSARTHVPQVLAPISVRTLLERIPSHALCLVPWEDAQGLSVKGALTKTSVREIAIVIGPEGGMDEQTVEALKASGALPVTLGRRIFRTETAGLAALIMALSYQDDYEGS